MSILNWWKKKKWEKEFEHVLEQSSEIRRQFWKTRGEVDDAILTSDGLSDPFDMFEETGDNEKYNGYGLEFYIECDDPILRNDLEEVKSHWAF